MGPYAYSDASKAERLAVARRHHHHHCPPHPDSSREQPAAVLQRRAKRAERVEDKRKNRIKRKLNQGRGCYTT
jgi:hypothetical protein